MDKVSLIVPMHNASGHIEKCLSSILHQTKKDLEVILVDDHSEDDTLEKAKKYPFSIIEREKGGSPSIARNRGAENASGDIFVFIDSDIVLKPDSIEKIISAVSRPDTDVVSGTYESDMPQTGFFSQLQNLMAICRQSGLPEFVTFTNSAFCAIKRKTFESIGGYDETMSYYEDVEIGHRLAENGYRCRSNPDLKVTHLKRFTHIGLLKDYFRKVAVAGKYKRKNFEKGLKSEELSNSLKVAGVSSGLTLLSVFFIGINPLIFLFFLGLYSISMVPMLRFFVEKRDLLFALKAYVVCFEICIVSLFAMCYGLLIKGKK